VVVPKWDEPLPDGLLELVGQHIDPLGTSESHGVDIYIAALELTRHILDTIDLGTSDSGTDLDESDSN
jgi:hypothetical protein